MSGPSSASSAAVLQVILIGRGLVGTELLAQLHAAPSPPSAPTLRVVAVANSVKTHASAGGLSGPDFVNAEGEAELTDLKALLPRFASAGPTVVVDCSASGAVAALYPEWLGACSVVTANKIANSGPLDVYKSMREAADRSGACFFYEANVGAGLPVISAISDMVKTGDGIRRIEGVLSGTLGFIFNEFDGSVPFSAVVKRAQELGYTEPNPQNDLSGADVVRKVVILAREVGLDVSMDDVTVERLVPTSLPHGPTELGAVPSIESVVRPFDADLEMRRSASAEACEVLRYVGVVDVESGTCSASLRRYSKSHPFGRLTGSDNMLSITTARYLEQPLVIQGPGAGASVTAAGVFADILRVASVQCSKRATAVVMLD